LPKPKQRSARIGGINGAATTFTPRRAATREGGGQKKHIDMLEDVSKFKDSGGNVA